MLDKCFARFYFYQYQRVKVNISLNHFHPITLVIDSSALRTSSTFYKHSASDAHDLHILISIQCQHPTETPALLNLSSSADFRNGVTSALQSKCNRIQSNLLRTCKTQTPPLALAYQKQFLSQVQTKPNTYWHCTVCTHVPSETSPSICMSMSSTYSPQNRIDL